MNTPTHSSADPLVDEIRAIKESISARFDHDVVKLGEHLRREQERSGRRIIRRKPVRPQPTTSDRR